MRIVRFWGGDMGSGRIVTVHDPTAAILKFVELCQYQHQGSWVWLLDKCIKEDDRLVLEFGNERAARIVCGELVRAAKMTAQHARVGASSYAKGFWLWNELAALLLEEAKEVQEKDPFGQRDFWKGQVEGLARAEDAAWMAMPGKPEPPPLYGMWFQGKWCLDSLGRVIFATDQEILKARHVWHHGTEVREIPHDMRWWLARGVNMVG